MKKSQLLAAPSLFSMARRCVLTVVLLVTGYSAALAASPNIMISTDMMQPHLYLTNIDTDKRIKNRSLKGPSVAGGTATAHNHHPGRQESLSLSNEYRRQTSDDPGSANR